MADKKGHGYNNLVASNGTPIACYGSKLVTCSLGLRREFAWRFVVAAVEQPLLGADFLSYFGLVVDLKNRLLKDETTSLASTVASVDVSHGSHSIAVALNSECEFQKILTEFPMLPNPNLSCSKTSLCTKHHILTSGSPVYSKARRLPPDRLHAAKSLSECWTLEPSVFLRVRGQAPYCSYLKLTGI
jgi:hypothetical protein